MTNITGLPRNGERRVEAVQDLARLVAVGADEHAVWMGEVLDGGAFAQELRVRADGEVEIGAERLEARLDLAAGADGNRRLGGDDGEVFEMRRDFLDGGVDVGEIGIAVAAAHRRADGEKDDGGALGRVLEIGGEGEAAGRHIALHEVVEAGLVDGRAAGIQIGGAAPGPCRRRRRSSRTRKSTPPRRGPHSPRRSCRFSRFASRAFRFGANRYLMRGPWAMGCGTTDRGRARRIPASGARSRARSA